MADSAEPAATTVPQPSRNPLRRLYLWVLSWAHRPGGTWALAVFAFIDSSFFPIPPLFLQVALSIEKPKRSFWYATVDTVASVAGACLGYVIGYALWDFLGNRIVGDITPEARVTLITSQFVVTLVYAFVPLPYKFITIASGYLHLDLVTLLLASTIGRALRFYALGAVCFFLDARAKPFIERYFNRICVAGGVLLAGILVLLKLLHGRFMGGPS